MQIRFCNRCKSDKQLSEFTKSSHTKSGYRWDCKECCNERRRESYQRNKQQRIKDTNKWREKNKDRHKQYTKDYRAGIKRKLIEGYGGKCTCCGEMEITFLTLEHLNSDGQKHRKEIGSSMGVYRDVIKRGFPVEYTVLCMNCNHAKRFGRICPHQAAIAKAEGKE